MERREGPVPSSTFGSVTVLDVEPRPRPVPPPACCSTVDASPACTSGSCRRSAGWPRRSGRTTPTSTSTATSATSRCPARAPSASCSTWPRCSCRTRSTAPARCGSSSLVDGLTGGRAALVQKMHHTITDGEGGIRLSEQFIDVVPRRARRRRDRDRRRAADRPARLLEHRRRHARPTAGAAPSGIAQRAVGLAAEHRPPPRPASAPWAPTLVETGRSLHAPAHGDRPAPLAAVERAVPAPPARGARRRLRRRPAARPRRSGGSLNDLFVTAAAGGAGAYHRDLGAPVDELRMAMPVSTRTGPLGRRQQLRARPGCWCPPATSTRRPASQPVHERARPHEAASGPSAWSTGLAGVVNLLPTSVRRAHRPPAGRDRRLRHLERAGRAVRPLHRRRPHRGDLPARPAGGHRVQPHDDVVPRLAQHRPARRHGRGHTSRDCFELRRAAVDGARYAEPDRRRATRRPGSGRELGPCRPVSWRRARRVELGHRQLGGGEQRADVEEQVGDLVGDTSSRWGMSPRPVVDDRERLVDHVYSWVSVITCSDRSGVSTVVAPGPTSDPVELFPARSSDPVHLAGTHCSDSL